MPRLEMSDLEISLCRGDKARLERRRKNREAALNPEAAFKHHRICRVHEVLTAAGRDPLPGCTKEFWTNRDPQICCSTDCSQEWQRIKATLLVAPQYREKRAPKRS